MRAAAARKSPGLYVRRHADHHQAPVEEDSVDRPAHEPRVNRCRGPQEKPLTFAEWASAEQAPEPGERLIGHEAPLAGEPAVRVLERNLH